jgi:hypothetical protein
LGAIAYTQTAAAFATTAKDALLLSDSDATSILRSTDAILAVAPVSASLSENVPTKQIPDANSTHEDPSAVVPVSSSICDNVPTKQSPDTSTTRGDTSAVVPVVSTSFSDKIPTKPVPNTTQDA